MTRQHILQVLTVTIGCLYIIFEDFSYRSMAMAGLLISLALMCINFLFKNKEDI